MSQCPDTPQEQPAQEDTTWASRYGTDLAPIALKYGRRVFEFTMVVGSTQHAINLVLRRVAGNRELVKALAVIANNCNNFANLAMILGNFEQDFQRCKVDIETTHPSVVVPQGTGKIILPQ